MSSYINLPKCGSLEIITGCMYSKKSAILTDRLGEYVATGASKVCLVTCTKDARNFISRDLTVSDDITKSGVTLIKKSSLDEKVIEELKKYDVIGIDEIHLYDKSVEGVKFLLYDLKKTVFIAGIDGDYNQEMPSCMFKLIPHSSKISKSNKALCHECVRMRKIDKNHIINIATTTCLIKKSKAIENNLPEVKGKQIIVLDKVLPDEGGGMYEARCPDHLI